MSPSALGCDNSTDAATFLMENCAQISGMIECNMSAPVNFLCPLLQTNNLTVAQTQALLEAAGFNTTALNDATRVALQQAVDESVDSLYPSDKYMVIVPMAMGTAVAFITAVWLAVTYMPSVATTILRLRCGEIPTLRDPEFSNRRFAADEVSILTGSLFWGALVSSILVGGFVGVFVFFFIWQATAVWAQRMVAAFLGLMAVSFIRIVILNCCRFSVYHAFYRNRPALANLIMVALEWSNFALSAGFVIVRVLKLLLAASFSIGRIDRPFLAPGVGRVANMELDNYPGVHLKDLLAQEAHRHPYIEQLGAIYMMKLRYGTNFGNRAGSCWRLLFVYGLMPWLHEYRILTQFRMERARHSPTSGINFKSFRKANVNLEFEDEEESGGMEKVDQPPKDNELSPTALYTPMSSRKVSFFGMDTGIVRLGNNNQDKLRIQELERQLAQLQKSQGKTG
jgi:hypothetical protein